MSDSTSSSTAAPAVIAERRRHVGVLTLNRPAALNALSLEMIRELTACLRAWRDDREIGAVVLRGANRPGKAPAFCAGGDIRFFHQAAHVGDPALDDFFTEEYALDHLVHTFGKPIFALMDGITMGGGMGLAQGAAMRVVTPHSRLAMPETNIGLFPDVGGGWFLARLPGRLGEFLGLTGHVLGAADALAVDWADIAIAAERADDFIAALAGETAADGVGALSAANAFAIDAGPAPLAPQRALIDRVFAQPTLADIVAAAQSEPGEFAAGIVKALAQRSPLMMAVTLELIRRGRHTTLADELRRELDMMTHVFAEGDGVEGIRALAVDKDHSPKWKHASIDSVRNTARRRS